MTKNWFRGMSFQYFFSNFFFPLVWHILLSYHFLTFERLIGFSINPYWYDISILWHNNEIAGQLPPTDSSVYIDCLNEHGNREFNTGGFLTSSFLIVGVPLVHGLWCQGFTCCQATGLSSLARVCYTITSPLTNTYFPYKLGNAIDHFHKWWGIMLFLYIYVN